MEAMEIQIAASILIDLPHNNDKILSSHGCSAMIFDCGCFFLSILPRKLGTKSFEHKLQGWKYQDI